MIKPKKSKLKIIIGIVTAVLVLFAVILMSIQIQEVTVTGNKHYTSQQITNLLFKERWDKNSVVCLYKENFKDHEQIPFVQDYKIEFQSFSRIEVIVYEKSVVGYVSYMNSCMYFDKDGIIVESSREKLDGIPWITGLKFGHIALHQPLPVENERIFGEILNLTQLLSTYEIVVDRIQYDAHGDATLFMGDIRVCLGSNDQMSGKISELKDQSAVFSGLSGTLYLDTYDEAETATSYRFVKDK